MTLRTAFALFTVMVGLHMATADESPAHEFPPGCSRCVHDYSCDAGLDTALCEAWGCSGSGAACGSVDFKCLVAGGVTVTCAPPNDM